MGKSELRSYYMKINEIFYSLEGEGQNMGYPTVFIRLSGCNLNCSWCDTEHETYKEMEIREIIDEIKKYNCDTVKITGGEPLIHELRLPLLCRVLRDEGYSIGIETNGTIYDHSIFSIVHLICMDIKTPSSGEKSNMNVIRRTYMNYKDKLELKMVISDESDLRFVENHLIENVILMPNSKSEFTMDLIDKMKNRFPHYRFGLRLHKVLKIV